MEVCIAIDQDFFMDDDLRCLDRKHEVLRSPDGSVTKSACRWARVEGLSPLRPCEIVQRSKLLDKMKLADQFVPAILELAEARLSDVLIEIAVYP